MTLGLIKFAVFAGMLLFSQQASATINPNIRANRAADLSIALYGRAYGIEGETLPYTIILNNNGPATADFVKITMAIPEGLRFNPQASDPHCRQRVQLILCEFERMQKRATFYIPITFRASPRSPFTGPRCPYSVAIQAQVSAIQRDPDTFDNQTPTYGSTIGCVEFNSVRYPGSRINFGSFTSGGYGGVSSYGGSYGSSYSYDNVRLGLYINGPATIRPKEDLRYYITATNSSFSRRATQATVRFSHPTGLIYRASLSDPNCLDGGTEIICTNFNLHTEDAHTIVVVFTIPQETACPWTITMQGHIQSPQDNRYGNYGNYGNYGSTYQSYSTSAFASGYSAYSRNVQTEIQCPNSASTQNVSSRALQFRSGQTLPSDTTSPPPTQGFRPLFGPPRVLSGGLYSQ